MRIMPTKEPVTLSDRACDPSAQGWYKTFTPTTWRPLAPLVAFMVIFYALVRSLLFLAGLPFCWIPYGELQIAGTILVVCVILGPLGLLGLRIVRDMTLQICGGIPPALKHRVADLPSLMRDTFMLAFIYLLVLIPYVNLKPAIPLLNPIEYDTLFESFESALFGGVLPTQWLMAHSSTWMLACWDGIYNLLSLFMFVSLTIALYFDGIRGGARLVLAYSIGLFLDVFFTLLFPTFGPLFVHPEWFGDLANLPSGELSQFLALTVHQYAQAPGHVYACAGISAMPSYHVYGWICGFLYWRHLPRKIFLAGLVLTMLNWLSTIVLGWHYALDGLAGILLALAVSWLVARIIPQQHETITEQW
ncbi:MAG: hypothetical protein DRP37_07025 [Thermodesulfobacteriota bacterium]|nr:MAG: hypothetical protein DRP37_07025 [Thermodesulfobacteriota bacterium]